MPYTTKKVGKKTCVYKKDTGEKVGCTDGDITKYLAALHTKTEMINMENNLRSKLRQMIREENDKMNEGTLLSLGDALISNLKQYDKKELESMLNKEGNWRLLWQGLIQSLGAVYRIDTTNLKGKTPVILKAIEKALKSK